MIIHALSDLHGEFPPLDGGDLLIIAGDLTKNDTEKQYDDFRQWLCLQNYEKKIIVAGNHDQFLEYNPQWFDDCDESIEYLNHEETKYKGLKIWGSPYSKYTNYVSPLCDAFMLYECDLEEKYDLIPDDIDILITHGPAWGILDQVESPRDVQNVGSRALLEAFCLIKPKYHIFGHIHEQGGKVYNNKHTCHINVSILDRHYERTNDPICIRYG